MIIIGPNHYQAIVFKQPTKYNTDMAKKFLHFFGLAAYAVGSIGGFGVAMYDKEYVIGVCVAALAVMAFPTAKKSFKDLTE